MIKFALRRNLIYPIQLIFWIHIRNLEESLIDDYLEYNNSLMFTILMFLGEFFVGLISYLYLEKFSSKKRKSLLLEIKNIGYRHERKLERDSNKKINFLIIVCSFLDFVQFLIFFGIYKFETISNSFESRIRGTLTLYSALFYRYLLSLQIFKHQFFSLIIIIFCVLIVIIVEFIFQEFDIFLSHVQFILLFLFISLTLIIYSLQDTLEKYLFEYNHLSPFYLLMFEGLYGFIFSCIYFPFNSPLGELEAFKNKKTNSEFIILIFSFILYMILSGLKNIFRLETIKVYSPITSTFMDYILNPFFIIYHFASGNDFLYKGKSNWIYFMINLLMSIILSFCGCVYNEFIILFFCKLEFNTHDQVILRSLTEIDRSSLYEEIDEENNDKDEDSLNYNIEMKSITN